MFVVPPTIWTVVLAVLALQSVDSSTASPRNGQITFVSGRDGNYEIYVMDKDGSDQERLTFDPGNDFAPEFSPDGTRILFDSTREENQDIYVMDADGSNATRLTTQASSDSSPTWSPDAQQIAFSSDRTGGGDIYVMNADGSSVRRLTNAPAAEILPAWSPDGSTIAYVKQGLDQIFLIDIETGNDRALPNASGSHPAWSPDSGRIAFHGGTTPSHIFVINVDGTGLTRLTYRGSDSSPAWSPNGRAIVFSRCCLNPLSELFVLDLNSSHEVRLTNHPSVDTEPAWQALARPN